MRAVTVLFLLLLGVLLVTELSAQKPRKFKKARQQKKHFFDIKQNIEKLLEEEAEIENELEEELHSVDEGEGAEFPEFISPEDEDEEDDDDDEDPCKNTHCGPGKECIIDKEGEGVCQCLNECLESSDKRRMVCSNNNDTWSSDCQLYRMRCLCESDSAECTDQKHKHIHINYYGSCQNIPPCQEEEMEDFPRRMREWLFNIMRDMADREELSEHYLKLEQLAEEDERKKWSLAAVWKWCTLDEQPKDRSVSRHELFPIRAPLHTLEHCMSPFLDGCDADGDHRISLKEWANCLQLTDEHMDDLEDLCEDIRDE